ncbi:hypothetical protein BATDEDRAFT_22396 [Batrachochytrium dendrobatidis JAM81]|uniref:OmpH family outer membrane protein n=1 Tax=Batrachochytrium dendrobatidis (strain JAM81 / FGSC 10211) TaxID=684364 RepID=F4NU74_BATDJ|nr:uncharacterized protein BATDEDRAFT_22396 [Batrachochytrium dendrobatidis JAM81]EGF83582.1 hypothetical protein BATDEDRAFT_22396 [Batrachochytrium dendrobatidis JAM81]|eukprot:XP_006675558.1 hypothetical protein BATDEDRAFT_22396 [Batrachochytrium dendrobatidis JAM81]
MKLAVTVLASILLACSVTTATPANPSAFVVDISRLSEVDARLIEGHLETDRKRQEMRKNDPTYQKKLQNSRLELKEAREKLEELEEKREKLEHDFFVFRLSLYSIRENIARRLFGYGMDLASFYSCVEFLKFNPSFLESIYESLTLRLNQQSESEQASTSGTQSSSQHHESSSSSSETSTVQST